MRRIATIILLAVVLSACSSLYDSVQLSVQTKVQQFLANRFGERLLSGIDSVINQLSMKGGFLDDPLVRILLPPPVGLIVGVARDLHNNPQATLLEALVNQAAENTIPLAGPILKNIVVNMDELSLEHLLNGGSQAATNYLKEKGGAVVQEALLPAITEQLHLNGAIELYGELLNASEKADQVIADQVTAVQLTAGQVTTEQLTTGQLTTMATGDVQQIETALQQAAQVPTITQEQLGQYVAEQAMGGLFKKVAKEELSIRRSLESL